MAAGLTLFGDVPYMHLTERNYNTSLWRKESIYLNRGGILDNLDKRY
jgi:hypothetical protein